MFGLVENPYYFCKALKSFAIVLKTEHTAIKFMALRKRKNSRIIERAKKRLLAVKQIDNKYDAIIEYSGGSNLLTRKELSEKIRECEESINDYNVKLEEADSITNKIAIAESELSDMYTAILAGAKSRFGLDSDEVKQLGGTRKSERKRTQRKVNFTDNK